MQLYPTGYSTLTINLAIVHIITDTYCVKKMISCVLQLLHKLSMYNNMGQIVQINLSYKIQSANYLI